MGIDLLKSGENLEALPLLWNAREANPEKGNIGYLI